MSNSHVPSVLDPKKLFQNILVCICFCGDKNDCLVILLGGKKCVNEGRGKSGEGGKECERKIRRKKASNFVSETWMASDA
jgi:hypothetical protein